MALGGRSSKVPWRLQTWGCFVCTFWMGCSWVCLQVIPEHRAPEREMEGGGSGEGEEEEGDAQLCVPDLQVVLPVLQDVMDDHCVGGDVQEHPVLPVHQAVHSQAAVVAKHPGQVLQGKGSSWLSAARTKRAQEVCGVMEEGGAGVPGAMWAVLVALCLLVLTRG